MNTTDRIVKWGRQIVQDMGGYRPMTAEESRSLYDRWRQEGDLSARNELIGRMMPLAVKVATRYASRYRDPDALISATLEGLVEAIEEYAPDRARDGLPTTIVYLRVRERAIRALRRERHGGIVSMSRRLPYRIRITRAWGNAAPLNLSRVIVVQGDGAESEPDEGSQGLSLGASAVDYRECAPDQTADQVSQLQELERAIDELAIDSPQHAEILRQSMSGESDRSIAMNLGLSASSIDIKKGEAIVYLGESIITARRRRRSIARRA